MMVQLDPKASVLGALNRLRPPIMHVNVQNYLLLTAPKLAVRTDAICQLLFPPFLLNFCKCFLPSAKMPLVWLVLQQRRGDANDCS